MSIKVSVPAGDLIALAETAAFFQRLASQKARTPSNELYVLEAERIAGRSFSDIPLDELAGKTVAANCGAECGCHTKEYMTSAPVYTAADLALTPENVPPMSAEAEHAISRAVDQAVVNAAAAFGVPVVAAAPVVEPPQPQVAPQIPVGHPLNTPPVPYVPTGGIELDSRGLPWDHRIHSSTKNKCKTGEWKNIKGVDKDLLSQVEAELRTAMAGAPVAPVPPVAITPTEVIPPAPQTAPPAPAAPVIPIAPVIPAASIVTDCPTSFPQFLQVITGKCTSRVLSYDEVNQVCQKHGLSGIPLLNARPDLIPAIYAELEALWTTRTVG